jgi:SAM-dependent methyltransferase
MDTRWDKKRSIWYCRAVEQSNYPGNAVSALTPLLRTCESVLDIGAGCGALSIPIARKTGRVTAIEPSRWMYKLLLQRAKEAGVKNIKAYHTGWKGTRLQGKLYTTLKPHDIVICANLPHHIICSIYFLRFITSMAKRYVVYLQNAGGWNRFYYRELYPMLLKKKYTNECDYINTYNFLHKKGVIANVTIFEFFLDQPFEDFNEAVDFWKHRLSIKLTPDKEKLLKNFLRKKLIPAKKGRGLSAPFGLRRAALTWWKP